MKRPIALSIALALSGLTSTLAHAQTTEVVASGLQNPWGVAFIGDGRMLVTERPGRMRVVGADGRLGAPLAGLPSIEAGGQGGLLDVIADLPALAALPVYANATPDMVDAILAETLPPPLLWSASGNASGRS